MKTFARLIRRYVLATAGIILVVVALLLGMTIYAGVRYNGASDSVQKVGALAEALHPTADGLQWDAAHTPAEWMHGYAWAMVLPVVQLARGTPFAGGGRRAGHFSSGRRGAAAHHRLCRGAGRKAERDRRAAAPPQ